ncbi:MAG: hypothetical protein N2053_09970, partial [Chitinispirillaceae bacterium]|nr:hypothetical protein [Chitinispirillaceae bacterium]
MYRNLLKIVLILLTCNFPEAKSIRKIELLSVKPAEIIMSVEIKPSLREKEDTGFVGISLTPEVTFSGTVTFSNGNSAPLLPVSEGWAGEDYIKWAQFTTERALFTDTVQHAFIKIFLSSPFFAGISDKELKFSNGILKIEKSKSLYKAKNSSSGFSFTLGVRIEVDKDGIYQISGKSLKEKGVPIEKIETKTYQLFCRGKEIPIYIPNEHHKNLEENDFILFYGEKLKKEDGSFENYSFTNVYWLIWGEGIGSRVSVVSGGRRRDNTDYSSNDLLTVTAFYDTLHIEEDNTMVWLGNITELPPDQISNEISSDMEIDQWYWGYIGGSSLVNFNFNLPSPLQKGYAKLIIGLMGLSSIDSIVPDHNLQLYINDQMAGRTNTISWDGQKSFIFESDTFPT